MEPDGTETPNPDTKEERKNPREPRTERRSHSPAPVIVQEEDESSAEIGIHFIPWLTEGKKRT